MAEQNTFEHHIQRGLTAKLISFKDDDRKKITYHAKTEKTYAFKDPEEKVRAAYFVELILVMPPLKTSPKKRENKV